MSELLGNLTARREDRGLQRHRAQDQIDALVEGLAGRRTAMKSVAKKLVELEEHVEQLDDEILSLDMEIETAKEKAVNAQSMTESLTTFGDLYREAMPEERRELVRLRVNRVIWTPDQIRLALLDHDVSRVQRDVTVGSPYGIRTRVTGVRGRRPRPTRRTGLKLASERVKLRASGPNVNGRGLAPGLRKHLIDGAEIAVRQPSLIVENSQVRM